MILSFLWLMIQKSGQKLFDSKEEKKYQGNKTSSSSWHGRALKVKFTPVCVWYQSPSHRRGYAKKYDTKEGEKKGRKSGRKVIGEGAHRPKE